MSAPDPSTAVRRITKIVDRKGRPIPENGGRESKSNVLFQEASGTWRSMKLQNAQVTDTAGWVRSAIRVKTTTDAAHKRLRELGIGMYGKRSGSPGSVAPSQNATPSQKVTPSRSVTPSKKGSAVRSTANVQAEAADVDESMRMIIAMENTVLPVRLRGRTKTQEEYDQELARLISDQLNGFRRRRG
ncbi:hypothetical protein SAICODRAFT_32008 [Saitoella complicata NRRL Y-17804]|nr:uncharacterized protein SAICODRAFT_32008 [Saitoella complicata NRRL Y-17804]ODQ50224.1 hypothetical protein SAICODRAFT_32008 [Saitoella complicata NRRL Y-17804]